MAGIITANIGGQERSLKFGTNSTARYCEVRKCDLNDYMEDLAKFLLSQSEEDEIRKMAGLRGDEVRDIIYSGLWAFDITNERAIDYDRFVVGNWIDDAEQEEINKIFQELFSSNEGKVEQKKGEGVKKK